MKNNTIILWVLTIKIKVYFKKKDIFENKINKTENGVSWGD